MCQVNLSFHSDCPPSSDRCLDFSNEGLICKWHKLLNKLWILPRQDDTTQRQNAGAQGVEIEKFAELMEILDYNTSARRQKGLTGYCFKYIDIVRATPLGAGFVDIFIGQIHSESDDEIQ